MVKYSHLPLTLPILYCHFSKPGPFVKFGRKTYRVASNCPYSLHSFLAKYLTQFSLKLFSTKKCVFKQCCSALILLLTKRYNLYKVLARSTTFFQLSLFCATFFQFLMFMLFISSETSPSQRVLGLPIGLLDMGFHLSIFCTILSSAMRSTWPNQLNLYSSINPVIFCPFNIPFIS